MTKALESVSLTASEVKSKIATAIITMTCKVHEQQPTEAPNMTAGSREPWPPVKGQQCLNIMLMTGCNTTQTAQTQT